MFGVVSGGSGGSSSLPAVDPVLPHSDVGSYYSEILFEFITMFTVLYYV